MKIHALLPALLGFLVILASLGCERSAPPAAPAVPKGPAAPAGAPLVEAPKGEAIDDAVLREARAATDDILRKLLDGKTEDDSASEQIAKKIEGYKAAVVTAQKMSREDAAEFEGKFVGPGGRASFKTTVVKQKNGKWAIGHFSGPNAD